MKCMKCEHELETGILFCPYCGERVAGGEPGGEKPLYLAEVKGLRKSGTLAVYHDRVEFVASSIQKTVFNYSALMAVKKGLDRICFITEDGRTETCAVSRKHIHEAFLYIEKASRPYIAERKERLLSQGVRYSFTSSQGLAGGILSLMDDRAEFKTKSGQSELVYFKDVKSACISMGALEFSLLGGKTKAFAVEKEMRDEVLAFVEKAIAPYLAERKEALLARGIYYSFPSGQGLGGGTLDILADRLEYKAQSGQGKTVFFRDVRAVRLFMGALELGLVDGTSKSFSVDKDVGNEVLSFVEDAIKPYVLKRTEGFELAFGIDERIEVNEARGVFHIVRQGGNEITGEYPLSSVAMCERVESRAPNGVLGGVLSGGRAILSSAARAVSAQETPKAEEKISSVCICLTIQTEQGKQTEHVRFGDFPLGMSRTNKKYDRYIAEAEQFMGYLGGACPGCELIAAAPPEPEMEKGPEGPAAAAAEGAEAAGAAGTAGPAETAEEKDQFGLTKYIEGVSKFIGECTTPMTIAMQGGRGGGKNSVMKLLSTHLAERYQENRIWFHTWQFSQFDLGEQLPLLVGNKLIGKLSGTSNGAAKERAIKVAKGLINITSGFISQGSTDGQNFMEAIFQDNSADSLEKRVRLFSELVRKKAGEDGKVIIFIDDLDSLTPAKALELLEAMRAFFDCEGCVFVITVDYDSIIRGAAERYGQDFDESTGKRFFDKLFQVSFRVPVSGYNIENYVKEKLGQIGIEIGSGEELGCYMELIKHSVGCEPKSMDRLFNSFLLLKNLGAELYGSKDKRLMLFALICMQAGFPEAYDAFVRMKEKVTPEFLLGLCGGQSEVLSSTRLGEDEKEEFCDFARIFCDIINIDKEGGISEAECRTFAEVLDFSSITSQ